MKKILNILPLLFALFTSMSCKKTPQPTPTIWQEVKAIDFSSKNGLNSAIINNQLFIQNINGFTIIDANEKISNCSSWWNITPMLIHPDFAFRAIDNAASFQVVPHSCLSNEPIYDIPVTLISSTLSSVGFNNIQTLVSNGQNGFVAVFKNYQQSDELWFGKINTEPTNRFKIKKIDFKKMVFPEFGRFDAFQVDSFILVSYFGGIRSEEGTVKISPTGVVEKVSEKRIAHIFKVGETLYGILGSVYKSTNKGQTWTQLVNTNLSFELTSNMRDIQNQKIALFTDKIYSVEVQNDVFKETELDNKGLEGRQLMSVSEWQDKVYVVTTAGVFSKPKEDFLTKK